MKVLSVSDARNKFLSILKRIPKTHEAYSLSHKGKPVAVLLGIEDYRRLIETLELLSDHEMVKGIKEANEDIKKGRVYPVEKVFDEMLME